MNTQNQTIASLRKAGHKVRVTHSRYGIHVDTGEFGFWAQRDIAPSTHVTKGGQTAIDISFIENGEVVSESSGVAECSKKDGFNKKKGILIALGRALNDKDSAQVNKVDTAWPLSTL